jgi:hypothetical protein
LGVEVEGRESEVGRKVSMLSFVDAELSEEEELPSSAVVRGMAGGRRWGVLCCFMVGRARRRSDILVSFGGLRSLFCEKFLVWKPRVKVDELKCVVGQT